MPKQKYIRIITIFVFILIFNNIAAAFIVDSGAVPKIKPEEFIMKKTSKEMTFSLNAAKSSEYKYSLEKSAKKIIIDLPDIQWQTKKLIFKKGIGIKPARRIIFQNLKNNSARVTIELYYDCLFAHTISETGLIELTLNRQRKKNSAAVLRENEKPLKQINKSSVEIPEKINFKSCNIDNLESPCEKIIFPEKSNSAELEKTTELSINLNPKKKYPEELSEQLISLNFKDADIKNVLRILSESAGVNIAAGESINGRVTISLKKIKFFNALDSILKVNGYSYIFEDNIVKVIPTQILNELPDNYTTKIFKLQFAKAEEIAKPVRSAMSQRAIVEILAGSNSLMITDLKDYMDKASAVLRYLDSKEMWEAKQFQSPINKFDEVKVIKLKYVKALNVKGIVSKFITDSQGIIEVDESINAIVITGEKKFVKQALSLIDKMDVATRTEIENSVTKIFSIKNAKAEEIREAVEKIFSAQVTLAINKDNYIKFVVEPRINALIVSSNVPKFIDVAKDIIQQLDIPMRQVLIEAKFIEVGLDKEHSLGIDWSQFNSVNVQTSENVLSYSVKDWTPSYGSLNVKQFNLILKNLDSSANMNLLSAPRITTVDNKKAQIKISDYIITDKQTTVSSQTNTTMESTIRSDVGISLEVTPHINSDSYITLELAPQVNEARKSALSTGVDIIKREAFTTLIVENGGTVALGGLIKNSANNTDAGVPFLSKIPLLNLFFSHKTTSIKKTELVIFVTPTIINKGNTISEKDKDSFNRANTQIDNLHIDVIDE